MQTIKTNDYETHISECWSFAVQAAERLGVAGHLKQNIILSIFDKCLSPKYYFSQDKHKTETPTTKQLQLATKLGILNAKNYSKKELSEKLSEVIKNE